MCGRLYENPTVKHKANWELESQNPPLFQCLQFIPKYAHSSFLGHFLMVDVGEEFFLVVLITVLVVTELTQS